MKKVFLICILIFSVSFLFSKELKYKIKGPSYNKQIYDDNNNQITNFANWERIDGLYVSPDNTKMLVWHRPDKARAYIITLYDLKTNSIIAECEPGMACSGVRWTNNYLIYIWRTTGGGTRFEYRSYNTLAVEKTIQAYFPFESESDNILIGASFNYGENDIVFYDFSNGTQLKTINLIKELEQKDIYVSGTSVTDIKQIGTRKYQFDVTYYLSKEGMEDKDFQIQLEFEI
ncbi:MAG: hypothetical protein J6O88_02835 [Chryseobacterium sp.]|nr:hypothetical protein [Chryseobacterium sp.]MBO6183613.1 hypothetical protein [Chryseobacterium sp.]